MKHKQPLTPVQKQEMMKKRLFRICLTGIFIALGMVTKLATSIPIPVLGPGGMKIGFSGIFTALPAFLFGPIYGGIASALSDLIGAIVKPDGAYIPWLTVTAFLGGCIKGLLWQLLVKISSKRTGTALLCLFLICGILGTGNFLSLKADGVVDSVITTKETVPHKDEVADMSLSPLSSLATRLAMYQNDTLTLTSMEGIDQSNSVTLPASVKVGSVSYPVKKIGAGVFATCSQPLTVLFTGTVTSIDASAFGDLKQVTILAKSSDYLEKFCTEHGFTLENTAMNPVSVTLPSSDPLSGEGYTFSTNDTYRKYLSGYLNFMTFGLMLICLVGSATAILLLALSKKKGANLMLRIAVCCVLSGCIVTTANTEILRHFLAAYAGRSFLILWIPRLIEEIVVCLAQSYLIFLLFSVYEARIKPKIPALRDTV